MTTARRLLAIGAGAMLLQGCAAAAIPVVAAGAIGRAKVKHRHKRAEHPSKAADISGYRLATQEDFDPKSAKNIAAHAAETPASMRYLYGSGEAAAVQLQAYFALANHILSVASDRDIGHRVNSVVIAPGSTLEAPQFVPCGTKPLAIIFDIDETAVLNLGFESDAARTGLPYDPARWAEWERTGGDKVSVVPGVLDAVKVARLEKVAVVFNSNRSAANADRTAAMLDSVGLGPVSRGDTLWVQGDAGSGTGSAKDSRRWAIAEKYCVIAMAGDQLGDFSDLFNTPGLSLAARRDAIAGRHVSVLWGHGWFMLPNPVYGTGLNGAFEDAFPIDKQWAPAPAAAAPPDNPAPASAPKEK